ncbi:MAG: hypothetical protein GY724_26635 [Actinomycetia bacterium]|nr:hypothetical protein [Actinomycetes bacterium]MCP4225656.1 hypothetical protein [Actinomycetes bacterium]MCP5031323.1 hypothetical protein [Actinomycetes bacterium]
MSFTSVMTAVGLAVAVLAGSVLTAQSVVVGNLTDTFVRFVLAIVAGAYYLYLHLMSRGRLKASLR